MRLGLSLAIAISFSVQIASALECRRDAGAPAAAHIAQVPRAPAAAHIAQVPPAPQIAPTKPQDIVVPAPAPQNNKPVQYFQRKPTFDAAWLNKEGVVLLNSGQLDEAIERFRQAMNMKPGPEIFKNLAFALRKKGDLVEAEEVIRAGIGVYPNVKDLLSELSNILYAAGNFEQANAISKKVQGQTEPTFKTPIVQHKLPLGSSLYSVPSQSGEQSGGQQQTPQETSQPQSQQQPQSQSQQPSQPSTVMELSDRTTDILESRTKSTAEHEFPQQGEYLNWVRACDLYDQGNEARKKGELPEAIKLYRSAVVIYPYDPDFYHNLGLTLKKVGDLNGAEQAYREALRLSPKDWDTWYNLGSVLYDAKKYDEAKTAFLNASNCGPTEYGKSGIEWYMTNLQSILQEQPPS